MPGNIKLTPGRVFSGAAGDGPKRLAIIGSIIVAILAAVVIFMFLGHRSAPVVSPVAKMQPADPLPGGQQGSVRFHELARDQARDQGLAAQAKGATFVAPLEGNIAPEPGPHAPMADPLSALPVPKPKAAFIAGAGTPAQNADVANPFHPVPTNQAAHYGASPTQQPVKLDQNQVHAYDAAMKQLFDGMGGKGAETKTWVAAVTNNSGSIGDAGLPGNGADGLARRASDPSSEAAVTPPLAAKRARKILMPADRGIYGITKLASNTDGGGPVIVEAESGPIAGDRMRGSFEQKDDRMVVMLTSLHHDGHDIPIQAILVTPDTMETTVASRVDEHYMARFALPAAAAFVSGLGQAIAQSNTTTVASPLGGATGFTHLNFNQELGVAAGAAGAQIGQVLTQSAPKKATVFLDAETPVGIVFLESVDDPD